MKAFHAAIAVISALLAAASIPLRAQKPDVSVFVFATPAASGFVDQGVKDRAAAAKFIAEQIVKPPTSSDKKRLAALKTAASQVILTTTPVGADVVIEVTAAEESPSPRRPLLVTARLTAGEYHKDFQAIRGEAWMAGVSLSVDLTEWINDNAEMIAQRRGSAAK